MPLPSPLAPDERLSGEITDLPFPERSGKNLRIAVIDSGVNPRHPHIVSLAGGVSILPSAVEEGSCSDMLGHGTAVMAAIQEKAPRAEYFAVKVFHASLRTSTECLLTAITWSIERNMDLVNLSLGTRNLEHAPQFEKVIASAAERGVLLIAARHAESLPCLPGSLPGVIAVDLDWETPRNRYRYEQTPEGGVYRASGYPRSLPGLPRERNLHGISFAVANMTGFVARACEEAAASGAEARSFESIGGILQANAANSPAP